MRKILLKVCACVMVIAVLMSSTGAVETVNSELTYWEAGIDYVYPEENRVYFWDEANLEIKWGTPNLKITVQKLGDAPDALFPLFNSLVYACDQWETVTGISTELSFWTYDPLPNTETTPVNFYGGTLEEIEAKGTIAIVEGIYGVGAINRSTEVTSGFYTYGSVRIGKYEANDAIGCIVNANRTTAQYRHCATHEIGHIMGWYGHSLSTSDVMHSSPRVNESAPPTTLTIRDSRHLSQIYQ